MLTARLDGPSIGAPDVFGQIVQVFADLERLLTPAIFTMSIDEVLEERRVRVVWSQEYIMGRFQEDALDRYVYSYEDYKACFGR